MESIYFMIILCFLLTKGLKFLFDKYQFSNKLNSFSAKTNRKFFYNLSICDFCIEHHLAVIPVSIFCLWFSYTNPIVFITPFLIASLSHTIKSR